MAIDTFLGYAVIADLGFYDRDSFYLVQVLTDGSQVFTATDSDPCGCGCFLAWDDFTAANLVQVASVADLTADLFETYRTNGSDEELLPQIEEAIRMAALVLSPGAPLAITA
jgi:hypothetical protein